MPEDCKTDSDLARLVDDLEDYTLNVHNYQILQNSLNTVDHITAPTAEKLLSLCVRDKIEGLKYAAHDLNIILTVVKKIEDGKCRVLPNFVPSALAVLNVLKTTVLVDSVEALKNLCFEIITSYPEDTLICLSINHSDDIFEILNLYSHFIPSIILVGKFLKVLPPDKKATFVEKGIKIWFSGLIPLVVQQSVEIDDSTMLNLFETLELLTDELIKFDYIKNEHWQKVLENIHTPKRYPSIMKHLLEKGSGYWHRLWIVFIKLLKSQITKCTNKTASPINALLPCVEIAFKMDIKNRCRAFLCWNVLIENFSKETNEAFINKRLKLLMVPLTSNNAKVEETALAKCKTWWYLITCFQAKIEKFVEIVVIPFLSFCFGKPTTTNVLIPGEISKNTKILCVQAFINVIGHIECGGCVSLPKLNVKLLNTKLLVNHWKEWIHSINRALRICVESDGEFTEKQIKCVWKTFVMTIGELPENNIRRDLFNEALILLDGLTQHCDNRLLCVIVNILIPTLLDRVEKIQALLKSKDEINAPINKIIILLNKLPLDSLEDRQTAKDSIKLLTDWLVDDANKTSSNKVEWFIKNLPSNGMIMWTAMAESICTFKYSVCLHMLANMFLWPFKFMNSFVDKEESTTAWLKLYNTLSPYLQMKSIHKDIVKALTIHSENQSSYVFVLSATVAVLEHKLRNEDTDLDKEVELIVQLTSKIDETQINKILPSLAGAIVHTLNSLSKNTNIIIAEQMMFVITNLLKICNVHFKQHGNGTELVKHVEDIFNSLKSVFNLKLYKELKFHLVDQLKECAHYYKNEKRLSNPILAIYKNSADQAAKEIVNALEIVEESDTINIHKQKLQAENFNTPCKVAKKSKKEASIINTVVENGEEYVVVKSNWKFNPRKLTDNQKEKLQRKREDIPALYQDLSQSQDEFKLSAWKTDSQDTSTTSSKSTNTLLNEDVSVILKNIPNTDILPKIMENVTVKPVKVEINEVKSNIDQKSDNHKTKYEQKTIKDAKSPRMALKDRVFRNVRSLIEKSNISHECNAVISGNAENVLRTPLASKIKTSTNITNSAPSKINSERPSRVKRKPKKFDDLQLIALTKRRHSLTMNNSQIEVNSAENQKMSDFSNVVQNDSDNMHKATNLSNQSLNDNDTIQQHDGNIELEEKVALSNDCFFANKLSLNEKIENSGKETNNITVSQVTEKEECILSLHDINSIEGNTHDETKENIEGNILCTDDNLNKPASPPKTTKTKENVEKSSTNKFISQFKCKKDNAKVKEKELEYPDKIESNVVPKSMVNKMKETVNDQLSPDITKNTVCTSSCEIKEKIDDNIYSEDNNTTAMSTPKADKVIDKKSLSNKKSNKKKSRIESQLAIDMVEGHPFLKVQSEKRSTRKALVNSPFKRKRLSFNSQETKLKRRGNIKSENKINEKGKSVSIKDNSNTEEIIASQDFIESSQDSTITTLSVKPSTKTQRKKHPVVVLNDLKHSTETETQNLINSSVSKDLTNAEGISDIELPCNKTDLVNLTEEMDTEPIHVSNVAVLSDDEYFPNAVVSDVLSLEQDTQYSVDADTQPVNPAMFINTETSDQNTYNTDIPGTNENDENAEILVEKNDTNTSLMTSAEDVTKTLSESVLMEADKEDSSSSCNNDQIKKDFFDTILQISPIKSMSPVQDQESLSPETSSDYVVIKLASPVQSNGEPFETCQSPEIFTEDKVSPDKRDRSPPREEVCVKNTSPSSSLSLKRNRPQMRAGGRAAQMLGLCVPDRLQTFMASEKHTDAEEAKKSPSLNTTARRNLRILYNNSSGENNDNSEENEDSENFLKFKRSLPTTDCSPSGPILKRKLIDIADECTASPASKRKRVSFHDPPVSTTICVKKYIEPISVRSPQNSATKRLERQARVPIAIKSPRRLENVFKLDSVLTKAVESFSEVNEAQITNEDTEMSSLDETPIVEVIKTSDLNDTDPICKELVDCEDQIDNIAAELSSPAMKELLVKKFEGKVETIGDLAKMTELEVNRLCIKAPKVQVAKKVLYEYLSKVNLVSEEVTATVEAAMSDSTVFEAKTNVEVQTETTLVESIEIQTECTAVTLASSQTDSVVLSHSLVQTNESRLIESKASKSTTTIIKECLSERPDFVERLSDCMDEQSKQKIVENISIDTLVRIIMEKISNGDGKHVLSILQDHLAERVDCKDLILFCSSLLKKVYDKPT